MHMCVCICGNETEVSGVVPQEECTGSFIGTWNSLIRVGCWPAGHRDLPVSTSQGLGLQVCATVGSFPVWALLLMLARQVLFLAISCAVNSVIKGHKPVQITKQKLLGL